MQTKKICNSPYEKLLGVRFDSKLTYDVHINEELLEIDSSISIHDRNLRALAIEIYKIYHGISQTIMNEIFLLRHQNQYNLRNWTYFDVPKFRTVNHGFWDY